MLLVLPLDQVYAGTLLFGGLQLALKPLDLEHLLDNNTVFEIFQHGHEGLGFQPVFMEHRESQYDL